MGVIEREAKTALKNILEYTKADIERYKDNAQLISYIEWAIKNARNSN